MAWLYQRPNTGRWWIGYRQNGLQVLKSTGQTDKEKAKVELARVEAMLAAQKANALSVEVFQAITGKALATKTLKAALDDWIKETEAAAGSRTVEKYQAMSDALIKHFHATDQGPLVSDITREQMQEFLNQKRAATSAATGNMARKCASIFFRRCKGIGVIRDNPIEGIKQFKVSREEKRIRRSFTLSELHALYQHAPDDFWRYMVLAGFFTGLRLGDLATMPIGAVDVKTRTINIITRKTGTTLHIPIAEPLYALFCKVKLERKGATPTDPLWPDQAALYETNGSGPLSNKFYEEMLVKAGLAKVRGHQKEKAGRANRRKVNEVSFHCLRHSYVSTLAALGQNQQIVKALAGHSSDEINDLYTHVPPETLRQSVGLLPDITKEAEK